MMSKLRKAKVIDIYLDYGSIFNNKDDGLSAYVKSNLKKYLFCYRDIEENIPNSSLEKLKKIDGLKDIFKLIPKKFNGEDNASVHFVHQRTDPMILLPDLILKSYKRLFLNATNEEENLKLFYDLITTNQEGESPYKIDIFNIFCDVNKIKQNNNNELQNNHCTGENFLQENTKNKKPLIGNESRENYHRLCGGHTFDQDNKYLIFCLIKDELRKKTISK